MGFIQRFSSNPGVAALTAIEGINIIDLPVPGPVTGVVSGVACLVAEFADCTFATLPDGAGGITTKIRPQQVVSSQDLLNKFGGFDSSIGDFGASLGNGFVELRNKKFTALVVVPVNFASAKGVRMVRVLPSNVSDLSPTPVVPMVGAQVAAGAKFSSGANLVNLAAAVAFTADPSYATGTDGLVNNAVAAATQNFTSASAHFVSGATPVKVGDILVVGVYVTDADAGTYRVNAVTNDTTLVIEKLDGSNFTGLAAARAYRLHPAQTADTGGAHNITQAAGYSVPARPTAQVVPASTILPATVPAPAATATTWNPLSGLEMAVQQGAALDYTAATQQPNPPSSASIDALYTTAIPALLTNDQPAASVNILWASRKSKAIRNALQVHVDQAAAAGLARVACIAPDLSVQATTAAIATADPGVGGSGGGSSRDERVIYCWPGLQTMVPEAVNTSIKASAGVNPSINGVIDEGADGWMAMLLSNLPPERNPAEESSTVTGLTAPVLGFQAGVSGLGLSDYILMRQNGIAGPIFNQNGMVFQSGVTTSLTSGQTKISRRRMDDFITQSLAIAYQPSQKGLMTRAWKDSLLTLTQDFLDGLLSPNNPALQRISGFTIDGQSGNTPSLDAAGVFIIIVKVRTLASGDFITIQAEIGDSVVITSVSGV